MPETNLLSFDELCDRLEVAKNTLILFHRNPDADAVGSAFALKRILEELGSSVYCLCQNEVPARLHFLMDDSQNSVLPDSLSEDFEIERIISVDSASPAQLGSLWELYGDRVDLMIDHHAAGEPYADAYIDPEAAATGEILFDIVKKLATEEKVTITYELCTDLYAAISSDTGCFRYSNVTPATHRTAAQLIALIPSHAEIDRLLFETKTPGRLAAEKAALELLSFASNGKIAVCSISLEQISAHGLASEDLDALIDIARSVAGVEIAFSIREEASGSYRVSARSNSNVDVSSLCAYFGGGGHVKAAGCTVSADNLEAAKEIILRRAERLVS